jgi:gamma-glutamyltranspeptidase/glutathione hydrolase
LIHIAKAAFLRPVQASPLSNGIIAAGHHETARAGQQMLQQGGNAFDAAIAAAFASFVAEPSLTSLGGGGFLTAFESSGKATLFDFFVQTPLRHRPLEEVEFIEAHINFGTTKQRQYIGRGSAAVPGCPAGLWHIHERLGSLPMRVILEPALRLCREGVILTPYQAYTLSILEPILLYSRESRDIFEREGRLIREKERLTRPLFAETLEHLLEEGVRAFYEGDIAERVSKESREHGGSIEAADLRAYQPIEREAVRLPYRDHILLTNAPPSAGGSMIAFGLALLENQALPAPKGGAYLRQLSGAMRGMELFRRKQLTPETLFQQDFETIFQPENLPAYRKEIDWLGNTTHISVMDRFGNAASLTTTLGGASGFNIPGTGIPNNNMLGETDLHPGGMYAWTPNQRVTSMMSPSIVLHEGRPRIVLGSGGSSRIRTALLQVLLNLIDHGMSVEEAVQYPRLHWENGLLNLEPGLLEPDEEFALPHTEISPWSAPNMYFGGVHTVVHTENGLQGAADARRNGTVLAG